MNDNTVVVVSSNVESSKYHIDSMTLRFCGVPTVKQVLIVAKKYAMSCSVKPDFNSRHFEIHMVADGLYTKVQFYPCVSNAVKTISR